MARSLGTLTVDLVLKTGGFQQGADRAARALKRTESELAASTKRISQGFAAFNRGLATFGVGFSAAIVISELKQAASAAIEFGDEIQKATVKTGASAEELSALAYAAKQTDVPLDALVKSLTKMQVVLAEAGRAGAKGNEASKALAELGLTIKDLQGLSATEQFTVIADQISRLGDEAAQTSLLVKIFGKSGNDLAPLMENGAAGLRAFNDEAERTGAVLTGPQAEALSELDDAFKRLGQAVDGAARNYTALLAVPLVPFLNGITEALTTQEPWWKRVAEAALAYAKTTHLAAINPLVGGTAALMEFARATDEATKKTRELNEARLAAVSRGGGSAVLATPFAAPPGPTPETGAGSKVASEADKAREHIEKLIQTMKDQQAVFGLTETAALKYSITQGELARELEKLGKAAEPLRAQLLALADAQSTQEAQKATLAVEAQIAALKAEAETLGLTSEQLFEYQLRQAALSGDLGKTAEAQARLTQEWRDAHAALVDAQDDQTIVKGMADVEQELLELMGHTTEAAVKETEERFRLMREAAEREIARGGANAEKARALIIKIDARINLEGFKAQAEQLQKEVEKIRTEFGRREQTIQARIEAGTVSEIGGRRELIKLHQEEAAALEEVAAKYDGVQAAAQAAGTPIPEMTEDAKDLQKTIEDLKTTTDEFGKIAADAFETGLADSLTDLATGVKSLEDAAKDFLRGINEEILRWASEQVAAAVRDKVFGEGGILGGVFGGAESGGGFEKIPGAISMLTGGGGGGGGGLEDIAVSAQKLPEQGALAAAAAALTASATALTAGATTLTTSAATLTTGGTTLVTAGSTLTTGGATLTTAATALLTAAQALSAAAAQLAAGSAASGASSLFGGLEEITVSAARLAGGGPVTGPGTGTSDSVPAMLSAGEFVVRAAAVRQPGVQRLLENINDGVVFRSPSYPVPHFAAGGLVTPASVAVNSLTAPSEARTLQQPPRIVQQSFNFTGGTQSRQTTEQVAAAAARGIRMADLRGN